MKPNITWDEWFQLHDAALSAGFERKFAQEVLKKISGITPNNVIPQAPWRDSDGKQRRFDFRIQMPSRGIDIAIELDGADKDTDSQKWMRFLDRQNSAMQEAQLLLRFSNRKLFTESKKVINAIERVIQAQVKSHEDSHVFEVELQSSKEKISQLQSEIASYKMTSNTLSDPRLVRLDQEKLRLVQSRQELELIQQNLERKLRDINDPLEDAMKPIVYILGVVALLSVGVIAFIALDSRSNRELDQLSSLNYQAGNTVDLVANSPTSLPTPDAEPQTTQPDARRQSFIGPSVNIAAINAPLYVGQDVVACGLAIEVKNQPTRTVINLDRGYPNQSLYLLIWKRNLDAVQRRFGSLDSLVGSCVCGIGRVELYKNMAHIEVRNSTTLRQLTQSCDAL